MYHNYQGFVYSVYMYIFISHFLRVCRKACFLTRRTISFMHIQNINTFNANSIYFTHIIVITNDVHVKYLQLLSNLQVQHTENKRRHKNYILIYKLEEAR